MSSSQNQQPPADRSGRPGDGTSHQQAPVRASSPPPVVAAPTRASTVPVSPAVGQGSRPPPPAQRHSVPSPGLNNGANTTGRRRSSQLAWNRLRSFASPSTHDIIESLPAATDTARPYRHRRQRWRLWRLTIGEWLLTLVLCLTYFGILYGYKQSDSINVQQRRIFNALVTGNSLFLGVNLAASLRSYAKLLRWRMLAVCYRPLSTFDLVMGCDSLTNILKLCWKSRNDRHRFLPSRTQILCVLWVLVNLAAAVLVGIIGLTYNLDTSSDTVILVTGNVSVLDFSALLTQDYLLDLSSIQSYGVQGTNFGVVNTTDYDSESQATFENAGNGTSRYWLQDENPDDVTTVGISERYIDANAACALYEVVAGQYGNLTYVVYVKDGNQVNETLHSSSGPGGLTFITSTNSTCGPRCTDIKAFQSIPVFGDLFTSISQPLFFVCNNTVSQVQNLPTDAGSAVQYEASDEIARMIAGAIGWSGVVVTNSSSGAGAASSDALEYLSYPEANPVGFLTTPSANDVAQLISEFSIGAVAAMDDQSIGSARVNIAGTELPISTQVLKVQWKYAGAILIIIPVMHLLTLLIVITWANKAVIKDDSYLGISKVYSSLLGKLGGHGCMLRGDEIVKELKNPWVAYGFIEDTGHAVESGNAAGPGTTTNTSTATGTRYHADVFDMKSGMVVERSFREGMYDGVGGGSCTQAECIRCDDQRSREVDLEAHEVAMCRIGTNARDYF